ncbi:MAG: hypothetical protein R3F59_17205 [Myxococcota bacterium]
MTYTGGMWLSLLLSCTPPPPADDTDKLVLEPPAPDSRASRVFQTPGAPAELRSVSLTPGQDVVIELRNTSDHVLAGYKFEVRLYDASGHHLPNGMGWPTFALDRTGAAPTAARRARSAPSASRGPTSARRPTPPTST